MVSQPLRKEPFVLVPGITGRKVGSSSLFKNGGRISSQPALIESRIDLNAWMKAHRIGEVEEPVMLRRELGDRSPPATELVELTPELQTKIIALTRELFPGPIRIETDIDPDFPDDKRFVVEVEAQGEFREILGRELRWHDKLWELVGKSAGMHFGLCVFPK